jgi:hypothetical protein
MALGILYYPDFINPDTRFDYRYRGIWSIFLIPLIIIPISVRGMFFSLTISAKGITRERWQGFNKPAKVVGYLEWSDIKCVRLHEHATATPRIPTGAVSLLFEGFDDGIPLTLSIDIANSGFQQYALRAVKYAVGKLPQEVIDDAVWEYLKDKK